MNQTGRILEEVKKAVCGKDHVLVWVLTVLLARGHVLLEDIPGVGKTTMALAFSRALGLEYGRVQFTPDVLPSDITGYSVYQKETGKLVYQPGAVLCNLFLADELNRATSRTQSALLEAMEEGQVTDVVDTGGEIKEIPCLEFYGGMIVADFVRDEVEWQEGDDILVKIKDCYSRESGKGLAIIQGADFARFSWLKDTRINPLR